jgi:uncharacterized membrane protein YgdD (TMEM256/DUF423 family)
MTKLFLALASLSGFLAVAFGAFGAHALKSKLDADMLSVYQTAVQYQFIHTLAMFGIGLLLMRISEASLALNVSGLAFALGIIFFSGSLYGLALGGPGWLGPITPLGGLAFMIGWLSLLWFTYHADKSLI